MLEASSWAWRGGRGGSRISYRPRPSVPFSGRFVVREDGEGLTHDIMDVGVEGGTAASARQSTTAERQFVPHRGRNDAIWSIGVKPGQHPGVRGPGCRIGHDGGIQEIPHRQGASGIRVGMSTRLPAKSQGLGRGSGSIPMMWLWECGNLAFRSRFPHFHSPCSAAARFQDATRRRQPRLGVHRAGRPVGRPPGGNGST